MAFTVAAEWWDEIYRSTSPNGLALRRRLAIVERFVARLPPGSTVRALDVGCGAGHLAVRLAQRGVLVTALDAVPSMLERVGRNAAENGVSDHVRVVTADAEQLPFGASTFDVAVALGVVPWMSSPTRALEELARVVRPGSFLIVTASNRYRLVWLADPLTNPILAPLVEPLKCAVRRVFKRMGMRLRAAGDLPKFHVHSSREFERMLRFAGFEKLELATCGFGPFTFCWKKVFPEPWSVRVDLFLQRLADRSVPVLRSSGAEHVVLARRVTS